MKNINEELKKKTENLDKVGTEINQLKKMLGIKQADALRLDGAITQLKELKSGDKKTKEKST